jgi:hypothetical protein
VLAFAEAPGFMVLVFAEEAAVLAVLAALVFAGDATALAAPVAGAGPLFPTLFFAVGLTLAGLAFPVALLSLGALFPPGTAWFECTPCDHTGCTSTVLMIKGMTPIHTLRTTLTFTPSRKFYMCGFPESRSKSVLAKTEKDQSPVLL